MLAIEPLAIEGRIMGNKVAGIFCKALEHGNEGLLSLGADFHECGRRNVINRFGWVMWGIEQGRELKERGAVGDGVENGGNFDDAIEGWIKSSGFGIDDEELHTESSYLGGDGGGWVDQASTLHPR
jgi:hypothetical protein